MVSRDSTYYYYIGCVTKEMQGYPFFYRIIRITFLKGRNLILQLSFVLIMLKNQCEIQHKFTLNSWA